MEPPEVPQRPSRSTGTATSSSTLAAPSIPPRPNRQFGDLAPSSAAPTIRSPLNVSPFAAPDSGTQPESANALEKVPSVAALPLVGQEGMEYASLDDSSGNIETPAGELPAEPEQTRAVAGDLPMHAPQASVSPVTVRSKVEPMTRMDSTGAAIAGLAKPGSETEDHELPSRAREYRPPSSSSRDLARSTSRPQSSRPESMHGEEHEHGIPAIGVQVPMYPNAGDVQAPSPSSFQGPPSTGVGYFNSGGHHQRKKSHQLQGPPGSYGLHGHGLEPKDQFEKAWYQKHPEAIEREEGAYGPGMHNPRSQWALSSDDLNKIVHRVPGKGNESPGIPSEDIGYRVSEEYSSRFNSPQMRAVKSRTSSQTHVESPLRRAVTASDIPDAHAFDSENEDDRMHLGPPRKSSTPFLASDELQKYPSSEYHVPAVSPAMEKQDDDDYFASMNTQGSHGQTRSGRSSRQGSRPGSAKFHHEHESMGTPLDEIEEYEPLFKEEEKFKAPVGRIKRPELEKHKFPSMDVWEDTPTSAQLVTEIEDEDDDEDEPEDDTAAAASAGSRTTARNQQLERTTTSGSAFDGPPSFLADEERKNVKIEHPSYHPRLQRSFPSRDIWEDTPDSLRLETSVDEAQQREMTSPQEKPPVPARPVRAKPAESTSAQPAVPPRPPQRTRNLPPADASPVERQPPTLPDRPKPQLPARPKKSSTEETGAGTGLTKTTSAGSTGSVEATSPTDRSISSAASAKSKPTVPAKPQTNNSKFSSISAGFMNDLNSRLQLGPQAKKPTQSQATEEVPEEDKAPLSDARKARARGPVRRKPADPSPSKDKNSATKSVSWSIVQPWNVWSISNQDSDNIVMGKPSTSFSAASGQGEVAANPDEPANDSIASAEEAPAQAKQDAAPSDPPLAANSDDPIDSVETSKVTKDDSAELQTSHNEISTKGSVEETEVPEAGANATDTPAMATEEVPQVKVDETEPET